MLAGALLDAEYHRHHDSPNSQTVTNIRTIVRCIDLK